MRIAVPTKENDTLDNHFGHCRFYTVYTISDENEITGKERIDSPQGCGCKSGITGDLAAMGVTVMIAGGIGDGAVANLTATGMKVVRNCGGHPEELVKQYLAGELADGGVNCSGHHHGHEHGDGHHHGQGTGNCHNHH